MKRLVLGIILVLVLVGFNGCSLMLKDRPPEKSTWSDTPPTIDCSTSNGWSIVDTLWSSSNILLVGASTNPAVTLGVAGLVGYSAIDGFNKSSECKDFKNYKYQESKKRDEIFQKLADKL